MPPTRIQRESTAARRRSHAAPSRRTIRRRRRWFALAVMVLIVLVLSVAGVAYAWSRPVPVSLVAQPSGCSIAVVGVTEGTDAVELADLHPGLYSVEVTHQGYVPLNTSIVVERFGNNDYAWVLEPLPQHLTVQAPAEASVRVLGAREEIAAEAVGALDTTLPAGDYILEVVQEGRNPYVTEVLLDRETAFRVQLDPEGQVVHALGTLDAAGAPKGVAFTPDGTQLWTTILNGPPSVLVYDVATMELVRQITLGSHGAVELAFSNDGTRAYASQMETALVYEIDTATGDVLRSLDTESSWSKVVELSADGTKLFVANWIGDDVSEIDLATGECTRRFRTGNTPRGLYATEDGTSLYVATFDGGELQRVDLATGELVTLFDNNGALRHIVGDPERDLLYISDMRNDVVFVHDMATGETREFVHTDEKPNTIDLSPDGHVLFVSCRGENNPKSYYIPGPEWGTILLFDTADGSPLDAIVGGNQCTALAVSDTGTKLAFSNFLDDELRLYEVPDPATLRSGGGGRWEEHLVELVK